MSDLATSDCTIIVLTFLGEKHLSHLLPTIELSINNSGAYNFDVLVVDNAQKVETKLFIEKEFPNFTYLPSASNEYLFSLNPVVEGVQSPLVLILNDDMKMHSEMLNHTIPLMIRDETIFSVNCKVLNWDGQGEQSNVRYLNYKKNAWAVSRWSEQKFENPSYTLYGGGGSAVFRTEVFNNLGGFDSFYSPAYCEDLDIGHRAWQNGYSNIFHPEAILYHRDGATIKEQFQNDKLSVLIYRNRILEMLRNGKAPYFLTVFLLLLPYRLIFGWRIDLQSWKAMWAALPRMPLALVKRFQKKSVRSEKEIIELIGKKYKKGGNKR